MPNQRKTKKKSKLVQVYDESGRWVQERNRIKGALRRAFRLSPMMREALLRARVELTPSLKKDGTPGKKNRVRYRCAICKELFSQKNVQVDHIDTVIPLWKRQINMTYDEIVRGIFCNVDNLQVLCSIPMKRNNGQRSCHKKKTDEENWIRKKILDGNVKSDDWAKTIKEYKKKYQRLLEEKNNGNRRRNRKSTKR